MQTAVESYKANMDAVTQPLSNDKPLHQATLMAEHTKYLKLSMFDFPSLSCTNNPYV